jgi:opacity protein-like surface antigen
MKSIQLLALIATGALAATAHAQYAAPRSESTTYAGGASHPEWEIDGGLGYLFDTNIPGADDGVMMHLGANYLDAANSTRETLLKYGGEFVYGNASSDGPAKPELNTFFFAANCGVAYRFNRHLEAGISGGVGLGGATYDVGNQDTSTFLFGFQIRPEITGWITDKFGVSMSYRFFQSVALNDAWDRDPREHALEFSVKYRF